MAMARRRLELRPERKRLPLVVQRVARTDVGVARVLDFDRRSLGTGSRRAHRRALPRAPALPGAGHREADPRVVRDDALVAVLALRLLPGARRAGPDGARGRPTRDRRSRPARGAEAPGRPLARRRSLVEGARLEGQQRRGGRLGLRAERAVDAARAPGATRRRPLLTAV